MASVLHLLVLALGWIALGLIAAGSITLLVMAWWIRRASMWQERATVDSRRIELR